jgi:hypothetical protein
MKVEIKFEVELPEVEHTKEQLEEFIRFEFRDNGCLSGDNPFNKKKGKAATRYLELLSGNIQTFYGIRCLTTNALQLLYRNTSI